MTVPPSFLESAGRAIARPGRSALIGAGAGAALNMGREAFRSGDDSPRNYVGAGVSGALVGAAAGGAVGGLGKAVHNTMLLNPALRGAGAGEIAAASARHIGSGASDFAQRQFHGLTGYGGKDLPYLDRIGIHGVHAGEQEAALEKLRHADILDFKNRKAMQIADPAKRDLVLQQNKVKADEVLKGKVEGARSSGELNQKFQELGMTSMPGSLKAVVTNPREASKVLWKQMTGGGGPSGMAMGLGFGLGVPAAFAINDIRKGDESATGGKTVGQKLLGAGVNTGVGIATGGVGLIPQFIAGTAIDKTTDTLGRELLGSSKQKSDDYSYIPGHIGGSGGTHNRF